MEGQQLGGRYQLEKRIGGGGMAIVYKARDLVLNRPVAVKVLRMQFGHDEDFVQRFRREAQAVASLSHPNVVSVYDVGQQNDTHYIVMEYIEGSNLKDVINQQGALPVAEAVRIAEQICDALDHAHQNQIIHRDIKPQNILIGKNGRVKVTDFGIARAVTSATITHTGSVLGSVHYFSPEQARGGITGEKSDIYSLGIVLYEMVTGQLPFSGDSPITVALKHLQDPLPEPREIDPQIPQSVENVILKALVKDPFLRYQSAKEMMEDLDTCLSPERLNEEKVDFSVDEEQTKVYPAITSEMLEQAKAARPQQREEQDTEESADDHGRKFWWRKALAWSGAAVLFVVLAFFGFSLIMDLGKVPEIDVPEVIGYSEAEAKAKLDEVKLHPNVIYENSDAEEGTVFNQDPAPPMRLKQNAPVTLFVSKGAAKKAIPSVINFPRKTAEESLKQEGFTVVFEEEEHPDAPAGTVFDQQPAAGTEVVPKDTTVTLYVSKGRRQVDMPNVIGKNVDRAIIELLQNGLGYEENFKEAPSYEYQEPGFVISTHPYDPGMKVDEGTSIPLTVSNGELPSDAKVVTHPVLVMVEDDERADVRIVISDARGDNQVFKHEEIDYLREYTVTLVLSPKKDGVIQVFKNGVEEQNFEFQYKNLP